VVAFAPFFFYAMTDLKFIRTLLEAVEAKEAEISIVYCKFQESGTSNIVLHIDADSDTSFGKCINKIKTEIYSPMKHSHAQKSELEIQIIELHKKGFSLREIAEEVKVSHMKVYRILNVNKQKTQKLKDDKKLYTYLMCDYNNGRYKIGKSNNPNYREKTLQSEAPLIKLVTYCNSDLITEKELHKLYETKRIRGEWFNLTKDDVGKIIKMMQP
jgi:hypothetical protein